MCDPDFPDYWLPSQKQLKRHPQMAILAALQTTLEVANFALLTAHPRIQGPGPGPVCDPNPSDAAWMANKILNQLTALHIDIDWYRHYVTKDKVKSLEDLPF